MGLQASAVFPSSPPEDTIIILEADVSTPSSAPFLLVI